MSFGHSPILYIFLANIALPIPMPKCLFIFSFFVYTYQHTYRIPMKRFNLPWLSYFFFLNQLHENLVLGRLINVELDLIQCSNIAIMALMHICHRDIQVKIAIPKKPHVGRSMYTQQSFFLPRISNLAPLLSPFSTPTPNPRPRISLYLAQTDSN